MGDNIRPALYGSRYVAVAAKPRERPGDGDRHHRGQVLRIRRRADSRRAARARAGGRPHRHPRVRRLRAFYGERLQPERTPGHRYGVGGRGGVAPPPPKPTKTLSRKTRSDRCCGFTARNSPSERWSASHRRGAGASRLSLRRPRAFWERRRSRCNSLKRSTARARIRRAGRARPASASRRERTPTSASSQWIRKRRRARARSSASARCAKSSTPAHLRPYEGRARVFIIADAHLLSNEAANALLKVLEEPPPDVALILPLERARRRAPHRAIALPNARVPSAADERRRARSARGARGRRGAGGDAGAPLAGLRRLGHRRRAGRDALRRDASAHRADRGRHRGRLGGAVSPTPPNSPAAPSATAPLAATNCSYGSAGSAT